MNSERNRNGTYSICFPNDLTPDQFRLLRSLVRGRQTLLRHALCTDTLEIVREDGQLIFPWFSESDSSHLEAYKLLLSGLIRKAKGAQRVHVRDREFENERYAFRCFLLQLGLIGKESREARKILLENLTGDPAYRDRIRKKDRLHREDPGQKGGGST